MDKRTSYSRALKMLNDIPLDAELSREALRKLILINLSSNEKQVSKTAQMMMDTGIIVQFEVDKFKVVKNGNL